MNDARIPIPKVLLNNLENVINTELRHIFENGTLQASRLEQLAADAIRWNVKLDSTSISFAAGEKIFHLLRILEYSDSGFREMELILSVFQQMKNLSIELDLVEFQNEYFLKGKKILSEHSKVSFNVQSQKILWIQKYLEIGKWINVKLPERLKELV